MITWASIGVGLVVAILYFKLFFGNRGGFNNLPEDLNQGSDCQWFKLKIWMWILISAGSGLLAYHQLPDWFPSFFQR